MALIKRKTKKALGKQVRRLVRKHGTEIAVGLATAAVTTIINTAVGPDDAAAGGKKKKKSKKKKGKKDS